MNSSSLSNNCYQIQELYPEPIDTLVLQWIFSLLYAAVFVLGLAGNIFILYCIIWLKLWCGIRSSYVVSLASSNLIILCLAIPVTIIDLFLRKWLYGQIACHAMLLTQGTGIFACTFTLAAIAYDKHIQISSSRRMIPLTDIGQLGSALKVIFLWFIAAVCSIPSAAFSREVRVDPRICSVNCQERWPGNERQQRIIRALYGGTTLLLQFLIPLWVITLSHNRIIQKVRSSTRRQMELSQSSESQRRLAARERHTNRVTLVVLLTFIVPWLPYNILLVSHDFVGIPTQYRSVLFATFYLIACTSAVVNPIVYCWMNESFKKTFRKVSNQVVFHGNKSGSKSEMRLSNFTPMESSPSPNLCSGRQQTSDRTEPAETEQLLPPRQKIRSGNQDVIWV